MNGGTVFPCFDCIFYRPPFCGFHDLCLVRNTVVKLGLELISFCQRESSFPAHELQQQMTLSVSCLVLTFVVTALLVLGVHNGL